MISDSEKLILHSVVRGGAVLGRTHTRLHAAAQSLMLAGLAQVVEFPDHNFVVFPPHMTWNYKDHKPVLPRLKAVVTGEARIYEPTAS